MKYYPYGESKDRKTLQNMSDEDTKRNKEFYDKYMNLDPKRFISELNDAFQDLSKNSDLQAVLKHLKVLSLLIIFVSLVGIILLYVY